MGTMVLISGKHDCGKTSLIVKIASDIGLLNVQSFDYSGNGIGNEIQLCGKEILCYGNLICNNKLIGFSSQGDNEYAVRQGLEILTDKFQRKFDILVLASLTRGKTIETPISLAKNYGYEVIVCSTYRGLELSYSSYSQMEGKNPLLGLDLNDCCKKGIENLIKNL